jgi:hypothetical protein
MLPYVPSFCRLCPTRYTQEAENDIQAGTSTVVCTLSYVLSIPFYRFTDFVRFYMRRDRGFKYLYTLFYLLFQYSKQACACLFINYITIIVSVFVSHIVNCFSIFIKRTIVFYGAMIRPIL